MQVIATLYKPEYVGVAQGRLNQLRAASPESLGAVIGDIPEGYAEFAAAVAMNRNQTITAITGAQMGEAEATRLREQIPDITNRSDVFLSRLKMARDTNDYLLRRWDRANYLKQAGITRVVDIQRQLDIEMPPPKELTDTVPGPTSTQRVPLGKLGK